MLLSILPLLCMQPPTGNKQQSSLILCGITSITYWDFSNMCVRSLKRKNVEHVTGSMSTDANSGFSFEKHCLCTLVIGLGFLVHVLSFHHVCCDRSYSELCLPIALQSLTSLDMWRNIFYEAAIFIVTFSSELFWAMQTFQEGLLFGDLCSLLHYSLFI